MMSDDAAMLLEKIQQKKAVVAVIGLGYVGLPLVLAYCNEGFPVIGFDIDDKKIDSLKAGKSYIKHFSDEQIAVLGQSETCTLSAETEHLRQADVVIICVPTPLKAGRVPDMSYVIGTSQQVCKVLRKNQLIILESTTYPGTTRELMAGILEKSGLKAGEDFYVAYSPEREDPGNHKYNTRDIPKVVGGLTASCGDLSEALYQHIVPSTVRVSSTDVAESTKLLENIFRAVNIAMINEMKLVLDKMDINVWEVIEAAATKPFGFMPFYPGPGLGGHCIPIDPFYLAWRAKSFGADSRIIELAGEINSAMPQLVVEKMMEGLNEFGKAMNGSRILLIGMAYKADVDDLRESPSLRLMDLMTKLHAEVDYHDTNISVLKNTRHYQFGDKISVELSPEVIASYDAVLISTAHSDVNYQMLADHALLILDTRNAMHGTKASKAMIIRS